MAGKLFGTCRERFLLGGSDPFLPAGGKEKGLGGKSPKAGPDWLKQFDAVLPGYTLKSQLDILSLLKQVRLLEKRVGIWPGQRKAEGFGAGGVWVGGER